MHIWDERNGFRLKSDGRRDKEEGEAHREMNGWMDGEGEVDGEG